MISKWIFVSAIALALLSTGGSCREIQEEADGYASQGSNSPTNPARVAGSWSLILMDDASGRTRSANVEIVQIDDVIFGQGSSDDGGASVVSDDTEPRPTEDQGIDSMVWWLHQNSEPAALTTAARSLTIGASGRVSGTSLSLDLVFLKENVLYRLDLNVVGSSVSGSYQAYDSLGWVRSGSCYGYIGYGLSAGSSPQAVPLGGMSG
jgi:hypothetical protein